ncbi:hypothetical protein NIES22_72520 (plasmid) [Calothrix brevissima NIES-22]|nr:hypothetical protein NIES22_72520 [Calothrix brevissima NIES-22]
MSRKFSSTISSVIHCQPKGLGRVIALFAFEGTYHFGGGDKSTSVGILGALGEWLNLDQLIQSGRCKCCLAPI